MNRKIYLASSWRNPYQPEILAILREAGHEVYDFRNEESHFRWSDIYVSWQKWNRQEYLLALEHPLAIKGYNNDYLAMTWCNTCVLLLPAGSSAHLELGFCKGLSKDCYILVPQEGDLKEPELMYSVVGRNHIMTSMSRLLEALAVR